MSVGFGIDLDEVRRVIDAAEVLIVRFRLTDRRLLVDRRADDRFGPLVKVVPPAANAQERFRSLKVMRPTFRSPERILTFEWPRHARSLAEAGLWDHMARKLVEMGWPETAALCDEAFRQIVEEERQVEIAAIRGGEGYQTLWPATAHE